MLWDEVKIGCSTQSNTPCTGGRKKWGSDEGIAIVKLSKDINIEL